MYVDKKQIYVYIERERKIKVSKFLCDGKPPVAKFWLRSDVIARPQQNPEYTAANVPSTDLPKNVFGPVPHSGGPYQRQNLKSAARRIAGGVRGTAATQAGAQAPEAMTRGWRRARRRARWSREEARGPARIHARVAWRGGAMEARAETRGPDAVAWGYESHNDTLALGARQTAVCKSLWNLMSKP